MLKALAVSGLILLRLIGAAYEIFLWVRGLSGASEAFSAGDYKLRPTHLGWLFASYAAILFAVYLLVG